jgi:hypothetical protein
MNEHRGTMLSCRDSLKLSLTTTLARATHTVATIRYGESCLNGWTMGNIAISPLNAARFFRLLADGECAVFSSNPFDFE